jgi:hypothetical protein
MPDIQAPRGGIRRAYRFVDTLNAVGIDAAIVHGSKGFRCRWFSNETRVAYAKEIRLRGADLLVIPEIWATRIPFAGPGVAKVILSQNTNLTFASAADAATVAKLYRAPGVLGAVVGSEHDAEFFAYALSDLVVRRIHYGVDTNLHHATDPKSFVVSYIPRKLPDEARAVVELLRLRGALEGWEVAPIGDMDESAYAAVLRRSRVFLSFAHQEGLGLPPLEAMACGCTVVGFDGIGGRELFQQHGISVDNGDVLAFAQEAEQVLRGWKTDPALFARAATEASEFARTTFSLERERLDVLSVFGQFLELAAEGEHNGSESALDRFWSVPPPWRVAGHYLKKARKALFGSRP